MGTLRIESIELTVDGSDSSLSRRHRDQEAAGTPHPCGAQTPSKTKMLKMNLCAGTSAEEKTATTRYENEPPKDLPLWSDGTLAQLSAGFNRKIREV
jgi:hypothetical protein